MILKEQLEEVDLQLELMPEKNRKMLYISIFLGIVVSVYYLFGLGLQAEFTTKEETIELLEKKLAESKIGLYKNKIKKSEEKILFFKQEHQNAVYKAQSLRTQLERIDYLSSDAKGLADILERILKHSVVLGINIDKITIDDLEETYTQQITKHGHIKIQGVADFRSVLKLLRFIEAQETLTDIENVRFNLEVDKYKPSFFITITGYGVSL